jgi:hypothetical protein
MNKYLKMMLVRGGYMDAAGDGTGAAGDGANGGGVDAAAAAAAAKVAADKVAADKAAADAGTKKPTDEEAKLLKEVMDKKSKLEKASEELTKLQAQLKQFDGIDPEAIKKVLADQKSAEEKQLEAKGDYDRLKQRMADEHTKEVKTLKETIDALTGQVNQANGSINELTIGTKFGQSAFISSELTLTPSKARLIYGDHFDLVDGKVVGYDKPRGSASRTALVDQYGNAVDFEVAMKNIIEADPEKDHLLKSKIKPGASSDSRKTSGAPTQKSQATDGISKIAAGIGSIKVG